MTIAKNVATRTSDPVKGRPGAMTEATGAW
jgi:hypothetical protein